MAKALTQVQCEKAKAKAHRYEVPDGLLVGLRLVVQPSAAKSWCVRTRIGGKLVKITIGGFPTISLRDARGLGREALMKAKIGINPTAEKRENKRKAEAAVGNTFMAVAQEYMKRENGKLRTMDQRRAIFERSVFPIFGSRPIEEISRLDITRLLDGIEDQRGPRAAGVTMAYLARVMGWHAARSDTFRSPIVKGMRASGVKVRARILDDRELAAVWKAADGQGLFGRYLQFLVLTATRRCEASKARWTEIADGIWTIPASRMKGKVEHVVPLPKAALALLVGIPHIGSCDCVFTVTGSAPIRNFSLSKAAIDEASGVTGWRLHDIRRTSRSLMARAGVSPDVAERCLAHVIPGIRAVYDRHAYLAEKKHGFEALATLVERIVSPVEDNVVAMRG
jgi:integrase